MTSHKQPATFFPKVCIYQAAPEAPLPQSKALPHIKCLFLPLILMRKWGLFSVYLPILNTLKSVHTSALLLFTFLTEKLSISIPKVLKKQRSNWIFVNKSFGIGIGNNPKSLSLLAAYVKLLSFGIMKGKAQMMCYMLLLLLLLLLSERLHGWLRG